MILEKGDISCATAYFRLEQRLIDTVTVVVLDLSTIKTTRNTSLTNAVIMKKNALHTRNYLCRAAIKT